MITSCSTCESTRIMSLLARPHLLSHHLLRCQLQSQRGRVSIDLHCQCNLLLLNEEGHRNKFFLSSWSSSLPPFSFVLFHVYPVFLYDLCMTIAMIMDCIFFLSLVVDFPPQSLLFLSSRVGDLVVLVFIYIHVLFVSLHVQLHTHHRPTQSSTVYSDTPNPSNGPAALREPSSKDRRSTSFPHVPELVPQVTTTCMYQSSYLSLRALYPTWSFR